MEYTHAIDRLAIKLAGVDDLDELVMGISDEELAEDERSGWEELGLSAPQILEIKLGKLERVPGKQNWLEKNAVGGLPAYIENIADSLHRKRGMTISRAIATAVSRVKVWCAGGGGVKPDTKAKACAAVASWEAKRGKSKAATAAKRAAD